MRASKKMPGRRFSSALLEGFVTMSMPVRARFLVGRRRVNWLPSLTMSTARVPMTGASRMTRRSSGLRTRM